MIPSAKILLDKFAKIDYNQFEFISFQVYLLENDPSKSLRSKYFTGKDRNNIQVSKLFPPDADSAYFIAEVCIKSNFGGGFLFYSHAFSLHMDSIRIGLEKITTPDDLKSGFVRKLSTPQNIADILMEEYGQVSDLLIDYNGEKNMYDEISGILLRRKHIVSGVTFGI